MVVAGSAWIAWRSASVPRPTRNSAWVVVPRWSSPRVGRGALDGGDVDVGGQVLAPDVDVRVVVDPVAQVRAQRAVAAADRVVQLRRGVAVVDQQERRAGDRPPTPAIQPSTREADLGALAVREGDALGVEAGQQRGRRRVGLDVDEGRRPPNRRGPRAGPSARPIDPVRRQRVEHLVGQDEAGDRGGEARGCRAAAISAGPWPAAVSRPARASIRAGSTSTGW